jgi:heterodisulfide reductase subunit A-like polyferredoxin
MLLKKLQILKDKPTWLHCDNESSIKLVNNHVFHTRTKHIEIQHHYMKEKVHAKEIEIFYTHSTTKKKKTNVFTKPLGITQFETLQTKINMVKAP